MVEKTNGIVVVDARNAWACALEHAEAECLADADTRARRAERNRERRLDRTPSSWRSSPTRSSASIRVVRPNPPPRSPATPASAAAAASVDPPPAGRSDDLAVTLAVRASVRHADTGYDALLMAGLSRDEARAQVADDIERVVSSRR